MKIINCPQCGGSELDRHGTELVCSYCDAEFVMETDDSLAWVCGGCGVRNASDSTFCSSCGKPLKKICFECGMFIRSDVHHCPECGFEFLPGEKLIYQHQDNVSTNFLSNVRLYCRSLGSKGSWQLMLKDMQEIAILSVLGAGFAIAIKGHTGQTYPQSNGVTYEGRNAFAQLNVKTKEEAERFARAVTENAGDKPPLVNFPTLSCLGRIFTTVLAIAALAMLII